MTTADILWMNIPLAMLFFALWVGIPLWMIHRHPDRHPRETRTLPAYLRRQAPARDAAELRELVGAGR